VDENEGWLHCFVCGYHEDAVGLVMMKYGSPFREAKKQAEEIISGVYTHNGLPKRNKRKTLLSKW
jgi:DNA primase